MKINLAKLKELHEAGVKHSAIAAELDVPLGSVCGLIWRLQRRNILSRRKHPMETEKLDARRVHRA